MDGLGLAETAFSFKEADSSATGINASWCLSLEEINIYNILQQFVDDPNNNGALLNASNCSIANSSVPLTDINHHTSTYIMGSLFYAYFTPVVFTIGILGNTTSLIVLLSRNMRSLSASSYLAALSLSDLMALVCYVLVEWLIRGHPVIQPDTRVTFMHANGWCQLILYLHYVSRFLSAWIIVSFTVERYIGVCHPLHRRHICTPSGTKRIIVSLVVFSFLVNVYKPLLSGVNDVKLWGPMCSTYPQHKHLSFILDSTYAVLITFVPFLAITVLNFNIIRRLYYHNRQRQLCRVITRESIIRLEFTLILFAISFCFILFNVPYFVVWCKLFFSSQYLHVHAFENKEQLDFFRGVFLITRAIFYINYCVNFFLYSITGAYFRKELKALLWSRFSTCDHSPCKRSFKDGSANENRYALFNSRTSNRSSNRSSNRKDITGSTQRTTTPETWL